MMKHKKRAISILTLMFFMSTQAVGAMPAGGIEYAPQGETPSFLQIDIPDNLARVEEVYEAPPKVDPNLILHIQNAHGNYEAQVKIKGLMDYLYKSYGFKLFFVEGAVEKMNADYLRFYSDPERNQQFADLLARDGELTGAELFLLEAPAEVEAIGIEQAELYKANYEAFKTVYKAESDFENYLRDLDKRLMSFSSKALPSELRSILVEWKKFEEGRRQFLPYVKRLAEHAKRYLDMDLRSLFSQIEWPQISRLLVLQSMETDLDIEAGRKEREGVVRFLREHQVSEKLITAVQELEEKKIQMSRLNVRDERLEDLPRYLLERLVSEAGPKGFRFDDFPAFSLYAGYLVLKSELDSKQLFREIDFLFDRIMNKLAVTPEEKALLELFHDAESLRKLFHLELSRPDWQTAVRRRNMIEPSVMAERAAAMDPESEAIVVKPSLAQVFDTAFTFYDLARQREAVFHYTMKQEMFKRGLDKTSVLTGGFHTEGMLDMFREDETNYGVLMPRIRGKVDRENYVHTVMGDRPGTFEASTMEVRSGVVSPANFVASGGDVALLTQRNALKVAAVDKDNATNAPDGNQFEVVRRTDALNNTPFALDYGVAFLYDPVQQIVYLFVAGKPLRVDGQYLAVATALVTNRVNRSELRSLDDRLLRIPQAPSRKLLDDLAGILGEQEVARNKRRREQQPLGTRPDSRTGLVLPDGGVTAPASGVARVDNGLLVSETAGQLVGVDGQVISSASRRVVAVSGLQTIPAQTIAADQPPTPPAGIPGLDFLLGRDGLDIQTAVRGVVGASALQQVPFLGDVAGFRGVGANLLRQLVEDQREPPSADRVRAIVSTSGTAGIVSRNGSVAQFQTDLTAIVLAVSQNQDPKLVTARNALRALAPGTPSHTTNVVDALELTRSELRTANVFLLSLDQPSAVTYFALLPAQATREQITAAQDGFDTILSKFAATTLGRAPGLSVKVVPASRRALQKAAIQATASAYANLLSRFVDNIADLSKNHSLTTVRPDGQRVLDQAGIDITLAITQTLLTTTAIAATDLSDKEKNAVLILGASIAGQMVAAEKLDEVGAERLLTIASSLREDVKAAIDAFQDKFGINPTGFKLFSSAAVLVQALAALEELAKAA
ncbi:MAG: hypothetical protein Q8R76_01905 [Candidatus Omnitrophota bacterium]|nr:hypothetical protein [Candidatus Omnitrophota bacterium]